MVTFRNAASALALVLLSLIASWSAARLRDAVATPNLIPGAVDSRGFRIKIVDADTGEAVRYNPCEPLHYVINPALAPPQGVEDVQTAIQMTSEASGLKFVYDGVTTEVPTADRPSYQPERYGDRWAPILISWTDGLPATDTTADAEGKRAIAAAGSRFETNGDGRAVYVTGAAAFDATVTELREGFGGQTWGQAMLHELGHVLGLDHVSDGHSVMNPVIGLRPASWSGGDRAGLWVQGIGSPCVETPETP